MNSIDTTIYYLVVSIDRAKMSNSLEDKKIVVTGGAGFMGSEVVSQLSASGAKVLVFDNFSSGKEHYVSNIPNVYVVRGDVRNKELVNHVINGAEFVIHMAALPFIPDSYYYPQEFFNVNVDGTLNVLLESVKSKSVKRFIHISTSEVYGTARTIPINEEHPTLPHSTYAVSKLAGDRAVFALHKEHSFPVVIIRPFNCYGPRVTQPYIIPEIATQLLNGNEEIVLGNVESERDFTFVSDTARGIILSLFAENVIGETVNLGSGKSFKIKELVKVMANALDKDVQIKVDESRFRPYDVENLICDCTKAEKLLNWEPKVSLQEGIGVTLDWISKNNIRFNAPFRGWPAAYKS